jgi:N-acyl-D-amino-acid deacylase
MYDLLIKNAMIYDGTGLPAYKGDIAVNKDVIAALGDLGEAQARQVVDAKGRAVSPGFIDTHSHTDALYLVNPRAESKIRQGVTTELTGQCGNQSAPLYGVAKGATKKLANEYGVSVDWETFGQFCDRLEKNGLAINTAPLLGHGNIRVCVIGFDAREPNATELAKMVEITEQSMREGAWGISSGLIYPPGSYAKTDEVTAVAKAAAKYGGIYATHMRSEMDGLIDSMHETLEIGEKSGATVLISHHKSSGKKNWGKVKISTAMMDEFRAKGHKIYCDVYPYTAGSTSLTSLIPSWAHDGGVPKLLERLQDDKTWATIKKHMDEGCDGWEQLTQAGYDNIYVTSVGSDKNRWAEGKNIEEIGKKFGHKDYRETVKQLLLEEQGNVGMVLFMMSEDDVKHVLGYKYAIVGSDASALSPQGVTGRGKPHPRAYGTWPRVLGKYVREEKVTTLEDAVRKMTGLAAEVMGLKDRGTLKPGMKADIVVFNPETVIDKATFQEPHAFPVGIDWVIVNGVPVVEENVQNDKMPGKVLRHA